MKTVKKLCVTILCLMLVGACEDSLDEQSLSDDQQNEIMSIQSKKSKGHKDMIKIPFKAKFFTTRSYEDGGEGKCTEDPYLGFNLQVGGGKGTHLGKFTTTMWFCGAGFDYKNGEGVFIAANGDELHFYVPSPEEVGHVLPVEIVHPLYEFYFQDPFSFNGGTGRFEGATGGGYTDSFVDLFDDEGEFIPEHRTDHKWTGTLMLPKDKKSHKKPHKKSKHHKN
jgi:hypothetical protein